MEFALPVRTPLEQPRFLPMTREEMEALGWNELDVLLVSGDAYVDHPSFGIPLLGRYLVAHGYRTGIIAQPAWNGQQAVAALRVMGRPRLLAGLGAGALDSMLAHYTAFLKRRHDDAYTPGGKTGARPNRAVIVYANLLRQAFPGLPLAAGGIEASLRRAVHYDFWSDSLRRPLLFDAPLDAIIYGMGEHALLEIVRRLDALLEIVGDGGYTPDVAAGFGVWEGIRGTARLEKKAERREGAVYLPSYDEILADPAALLKASVVMERECHNARHALVQDCGGREVVMEPPSALLTTEEMDALYALPFTRQSHPSYKEPIPAEGMIATSITSHRGCGGGCSFCTLALHQGRCIASRSEASILDEARRLAGMKGFSGSISDIGGP
ncbi:MAG: YgiQ family radical SAM protein, partial [Deltaproteobacteria bacterium]|nr:YgiQ family radical SAM protein [Deltaproteobacteria bacterium]